MTAVTEAKRKTARIIVSALAAALLLSSCANDIQPRESAPPSVTVPGGETEPEISSSAQADGQFQGDYYGEALEPQFYGDWHASPMIAAGFNTRYRLNPDGTFVYACSDMDGSDRNRYAEGNWHIEPFTREHPANEALCLEISLRIIWEGGSEVKADASIATDTMLVGYTEIHERYEAPEKVRFAVTGPEYDAELDRSVIWIDGVKFYGFDKQPDFFDGYAKTQEQAGAKPVEYGLLPANFEVITTDSHPFPPALEPGEAGYSFFLNDYLINTGNGNDFRWALYDDGTPLDGMGRCLMIRVDTAQPRMMAANYSLKHPEYGVPFVGKYASEINLIWHDENDPAKISLMFQNGGSLMHGSIPTPDDPFGFLDPVPLAAEVFDDPELDGAYFLPLYAILNVIGGGAMIDPFDDNFSFIYTGDAIPGYYGAWSTDGKYHSAGEVINGGMAGWNGEEMQSMEILPDGTFTLAHLYRFMGDGWVYTVYHGVCAFSGRTLALKYLTVSEYQDRTLDSLAPVMENLPFSEYEDYNKATGGIYARYVNEWTPEVFQIDGWAPFYSVE